jgi:methionine synthase / methylenetetrahydrofolate reductase(NADPH)
MLSKFLPWLKPGVDLILIETMVDLYAVRAAVDAARHVDPDLPVIASMTFTRDRRTLLGNTPQEVAQQMDALWCGCDWR